MKTFAPIIILCFLQFTANAQLTSAQVSGKWIVNWQVMISELSSAELQHFDQLPDNIRSEAERSFAGRTFQFNVDSTFVVQWSGRTAQKQVSGTWTITNSVLILDAGDTNQSFTAALSGDKLILGSVNVSEGALFSKIILTPVND